MGTDDKLFMYSIQHMFNNNNKRRKEEGGVAATLYMLFLIPFHIAFSLTYILVGHLQHTPSHVASAHCLWPARRKSNGWMRTFHFSVHTLFSFFFFSFSIFSFELYLTQNIVSNECMQFF